MNMEKRKRYVQPECEAIDMDVCVLTGFSANTGSSESGSNVPPEGQIGGAPGYQGPIDDTPVSDDDM